LPFFAPEKRPVKLPAGKKTPNKAANLKIQPLLHFLFPRLRGNLWLMKAKVSFAGTTTSDTLHARK
jgi:hypothetical protein